MDNRPEIEANILFESQLSRLLFKLQTFNQYATNFPISMLVSYQEAEK